MGNKNEVKHKKITVDFYLTEEEQTVFEQYCEDRLVYPYVCGQTLVKEFLMKDAKSENNEIDVDEANLRFAELESKLDDAWGVIRCLVEKNEKQEDLLAVLDDKFYELCAVTGNTLQIAREISKQVGSVEDKANTNNETKDSNPNDYIKTLKP